MEAKIDELLEERRKLKGKKHNFPHGACKFSAESLEKALGFLFVGGVLTLNGVKRAHCWNYDSENNRIIDLTIRQYDVRYPEVFVIDRDSKLAHEMYRAIS